MSPALRQIRRAVRERDAALALALALALSSTLAFSAPALAAPNAGAGADAPGTVMTLELPRLDGSAFVKLDDFAGRPVLINFWGSECPPCVAEMPRLFAAASRQGGLQFLGVAVDPRAAAARYIARRQPTYPQLIATAQPEVLLRRYGNPMGALPYTVVVDAQHRVCASHLGEVDDAWIDAAAQACGAERPR